MRLWIQPLNSVVQIGGGSVIVWATFFFFGMAYTDLVVDYNICILLCFSYFLLVIVCVLES